MLYLFIYLIISQIEMRDKSQISFSNAKFLAS